MEIIMPSLRDEAYQIYLLRKEKYSFSEKEQFYVRKIYNDIENNSIPKFVSPETPDDCTLVNSDFIFNEALGYKKLIEKIDKKIKAIKEYNIRLERNSTFHNLRNGNFRKDPSELIDLLFYVKYLHYNLSALENPESAYHYIAKNTKENNEYYKRYEVYTRLDDNNNENDSLSADQQYLEYLQKRIIELKRDQIIVSAEFNMSLVDLRQYLDRLEKEKQKNIKYLEEEAKRLQSKITIEQAKKLNTKEMFSYSTKNIIKQLGNRTFNNVASLRKVFEDKINAIKIKKKALLINKQKVLRMQEIQTGSLNIFARYLDERSFPIGIIQHQELLEISTSNNLANLPPTPVTKPYKQRLSREGKLQSQNLLQKLKNVAENPESNNNQWLNGINEQCLATSTPDSEPLSIASDEESISTSTNGSRVVHIAVGKENTSTKTSPGNSSLTLTPDDSISEDDGSESSSTQEQKSSGGSHSVIADNLNQNRLTEEENIITISSANRTRAEKTRLEIVSTLTQWAYDDDKDDATPILRIVPKSQRRKASGDLAELIKELIDGDKNFSKTFNENRNLMQKDLDILRSKIKIDLLEEIIKKAKEVLKDLESRGPEDSVYKTKTFYENIIEQAKADCGAIKALSKYTGLMFFSPEQKHTTLVTSPYYMHTMVGARCVANTPAVSPTPSPQTSPRK